MIIEVEFEDYIELGISEECRLTIGMGKKGAGSLNDIIWLNKKQLTELIHKLDFLKEQVTKS